MIEDERDPAWKAKLKYGRLKTPYSHFTGLAEGVVSELSGGFSCPPGKALMGMKMWALSPEKALDLLQTVAKDIGFVIDGKTYLYDTEPTEPPSDHPRGYDIQFTPFEE